MSDVRSSDEATLHERLGAILLAVMLVASVLAIGTLGAPTLGVVCAGFAVCTFLLWFPAAPATTRTPATVLLVSALGLTLYTAVQRIPLPRSLLAALAPKNADIWARALAPLHEPGPAWAPISLDPNATSLQIARGVTYALAFVSCLRVARSGKGVVLLERTLIGSSALIAVIALAHPALGFQKVYGVYTPRTDAAVIGPLLNSNHLAAYVNIGLIVALASLFSSRPVAPRIVLGFLVTSFVATEVWVASRGAVATMLVGMLLVVGLKWGQGSSVSRARKWALTGACLVVGVGLWVLASSTSAYIGLTDRDTSKLRVFARCLTAVLPAYPVFGTGRGAFESTFQEFREGKGFVVFTHPENLFAQWGVEWGPAIALAALLAISIALRPKTLLARAHRPIGPWCAVVVVVLHNMVDFSLEIPGVMVAIVACAACVVGGTSGVARPTGGIAAWANHPRWVAGVGAVAALGGVLLAIDAAGEELLDDRARLLAEARTSTSTERFHTVVRRALLAHPAEPYFSYVVAARGQATGSEAPLPWIAHTLERAPVYPPAHALLAQWLRARSPSHARVEYRITAEQNDTGIVPFEEVAPLLGGYDDATELVPAGPSGVPMLALLANNVGERLPSTQVRLDAELLRRAPAMKEPVIRVAARALDDLVADDAAPWCARDRQACLRRGLEASAAAERIAPNSCQAHVVRAHLLALNGQAQEAIAQLGAAADSAIDRGLCLHELATIATSARDEAAATSAIERLSRLPCEDGRSPCIANLLLAADLEEARGNRNRALVFVRRALATESTEDDVLEHLAHLASRSGLHVEAVGAFEKLARRHPGDPRLQELLENERLRSHDVPIAGP
jgi:hypothetical protein